MIISVQIQNSDKDEHNHGIDFELDVGDFLPRAGDRLFWELEDGCFFDTKVADITIFAKEASKPAWCAVSVEEILD